MTKQKLTDKNFISPDICRNLGEKKVRLMEFNCIYNEINDQITNFPDFPVYKF